jgi:flagellin-like hook-associated protein FlgL
MSDSTDDVLSAASNVSTISSNVKSALGRIGNLTQTLDYKRDFLTASITNSTSSVSRLFDTDMAAEQLNAAKSSIASNAATSMLSQLNMAPQNLLQLLG